MKKILFATDFSKAATQAMNYVIELARKTGAEISILNSYLVPAVEFTDNMPIYSAMTEDEKLHAERQLKDIIHLISNIKDKNGNYLTYKSISELGDPVSTISRHVEKEKFDMVVIGNTGIDDPYRWYTSTASELINEVNVPMLIVPASAHTYRLKHIVYAAELVKDDAEAIKQLINFANTINAWVTVMHIVTSNNTEDANIFRALKREINTSCNYNNMSWHSVKNADVMKSITDLLNTDSIDLVSLLKYPRKGIDSLFHKSLTKALIKVSTVPLLIIHKD